MDEKKVLIVDDEETSRKMLSLAVGEKNRTVVFARDGEEAVGLAREHRPDLILMDVMLPRINGYEATRIIKQDAELAATPVVAITARTVDFDEEQAREAGCEEYITKPFRIGALRELLSRYLND